MRAVRTRLKHEPDVAIDAENLVRTDLRPFPFGADPAVREGFLNHGGVEVPASQLIDEIDERFVARQRSIDLQQ